MTRVYYKEAAGAFVVFDVTRTASFENVEKWKTDLDSKLQLADGRPIPAVLLANKCDLPKEGPAKDSRLLDEFCTRHGFVGWFETSAKDNTGIQEAAHYLLQHVIAVQKAGEYETPVIQQEADVHKLHQNGSAKNSRTSREHTSKSNCSC